MNPSPWITRFGPTVATDGTVLDVACGGGRHTRWFAARGHRVTALDRDLSGMIDLLDDPRVEQIETDLEAGEPLPVAPHSHAAVVVTNYLWRPILDDLVDVVAPGGRLLYETFAAGNEQFGRPTNPEFLLRRGELLELARRHALVVVAYEDLVVDEPRRAAVQRLVAVRPDHASA
jgi:SAM-dependent methyltransferase